MARRVDPLRFTQIALLISASGVALPSVGHVATAIIAALLIGIGGGGPVAVASSQILARVAPPRLSNVTFSITQSAACRWALPCRVQSCPRSSRPSVDITRR